MAVTDLRVVCKIITYVSAFTFTITELEMAIILIFLEIYSKNCCKPAAAGLDTLRCRLHEGYHCGRLPSALETGKNKRLMIIWRAGPERDTIFHLRVTACREQGSHCHD